MDALTPWSGMRHLKREMDRLFDHFFEPSWDEFRAVEEWTPKMDVSETKDDLVVRVEVPGLDPKEMQVSVHEQLLTIRGEKKEEKEEKDERYHRRECAYGVFTRAIRLPVAVDQEKVTAEYKNGQLTIRLPKTSAVKGATIPIKAE